MKPLAYRMRPTKIEDIIGQQHLVAEDKIIGRMVQAKHLSSMILYGNARNWKNINRNSNRRFNKYCFSKAECCH